MLEKKALIETIPAKSGIVGCVGFEVTTSDRTVFDKNRQEISQIDGISFVVPG